MRAWPALAIAPHRQAVGAEVWDLLAAALTDFDVAGIDDNAPAGWRVVFQSVEGRDRAAAALRARFTGLAFAEVDVPDDDWALRSQAELKAVRVGGVIVAPPWDMAGADALRSAASQEPGARPPVTVVIQPSTGFGTGHHATTRLCLAHLQALDIRGRTALDVGTGSGVLALAASRLGAASVLAIDDDPDAIEAARANVALNPGVNVTLGVMDVRRATLRPFEVILANLTGNLLVMAASELWQLTAPGGRLVLSGFMEEEEAHVLAAFASCPSERRTQEDEWIAVTLVRPERTFYPAAVFSTGATDQPVIGTAGTARAASRRSPPGAGAP